MVGLLCTISLERFLWCVVLWRWLFAVLERVNVGTGLSFSHGLQIGWRYFAHRFTDGTNHVLLLIASEIAELSNCGVALHALHFAPFPHG